MRKITELPYLDLFNPSDNMNTKIAMYLKHLHMLAFLLWVFYDRVSVSLDETLLLRFLCNAEMIFVLISEGSYGELSQPLITIIAALAASEHTLVYHKASKHVPSCCFITLSELIRSCLHMCVWPLIKNRSEQTLKVAFIINRCFVNVRLCAVEQHCQF